MPDTFPRQSARTHNYSLGHPRSITIAGEGRAIYFLRSRHGEDPVNCLWRISLESENFAATLIADPVALGAEASDLPLEERRRRERLRESSAGITSYSVSEDGDRIVFTLGGDLYVMSGAASEQPEVACVMAGRGGFDPRLSPDGRYAAYICGGALECLDLFRPDTKPRVLAAPDGPDITWGVADFIAAEEMHRQHGYWWAPDSSAVIACRVDNTPVQDWFIADPSRPEAEPVRMKYPAAGTANAIISLSVITMENSRHTEIKWNAQEFPYLVNVSWKAAAPLVTVQSRDQKRLQLLLADIKTGATTQVRAITDNYWVELIPGLPAQLADERVLCAFDSQARQLAIDSDPVTPPNLNVKDYCGRLDDGTLVFEAWGETPRTCQVWAATAGGEFIQLTEGDGVYMAVAAGDIVVVYGNSLGDHRRQPPKVYRWKNQNLELLGEIATCAQPPVLRPRPQWFTSTRRQLEAAVIFPEHYDGKTQLPVLMCPYGGPGGQQAVASPFAFMSAQWFANAGFAVVVADGRGAPGRGPAWEKAIAGDLLRPALEDQVEALQAVLREFPQLDGRRVAIRGWSFGGYLAAAAVIHRPDVFAAAIAGAPVTDWRLYDTHYTERYLGLPAEHPDSYEQSSLLRAASRLERPLQIVHGLADDNVVVAHSLQLSNALLAAGRPHEFLPLSNVTHMASQEEIAENLLKLQLDFLRRTLIDK